MTQPRISCPNCEIRLIAFDPEGGEFTVRGRFEDRDWGDEGTRKFLICNGCGKAFPVAEKSQWE